MRNKLLSVVAVATLVFFSACSNEEILPEPVQTFTFTASMPDENPTTRVTLTEEGKDIVLRWQEDDVLQIFGTQNGDFLGSGTASIVPGSITSDGKRALFTTSANLPNTPFNFYGVYGGRGLTGTNALLPLAPSTSGSLQEVQNSNDVMLYFAAENVTSTDVTNGVVFNHLGSLLNITVRNNCPTGTLDLLQARLESVDSENENWAFNFAEAGTVFDLTSKLFLNVGTGINSIDFTTNIATIAPGEEVTYWSWYPILPDGTWPELRFRMIDANSTGDLVTVNTKAARTAPVIAGKNYRFYASFDGTNLNFTNDQFVVPAP